jgi:hypothetical protein
MAAFISEKTLPQAFSIVENAQQLEAIYVFFASICFCFFLLLFASFCYFMVFLNFESFLSFQEILYVPR